MHDGALPPDLSNPPDILDPVNSISIESNGYIFKQDALLRTREVSGTLTLNSNQSRSRSAQILAGGADRLPTDQGGHLIGRRFGGPSGLINLFAQDATINNSAYRILENSFEKAIRAGSSVRVNVTPLYKGSSLRPSSINVIYYIDNQRQIANIPNPSIGR